MNVSLIIPTLNNEKTIEKCLKSLKPQLAKNDEIIIIDSYSKDKTTRIAEKYTKNIIKTKGNRSIARNIGWKKSENEIIIFIESDSIYEKNYIKIIKKIMENKDINCVLDKREHYKPNTWVSKILQEEFEKRYSENFVPVTAWIYRKKALETVKGFDENLEYAEDADIGIRLKKAGYFIVFAPKAVQYHLGEPRTLKEVIIRSWKYGQNMEKFYAKYGNASLLKNTIFICSLLFPPLLLLIFLINIIRYDSLSLEQRIKLAFISIIRNAVFAVSYTIYSARF